MTWDDFERMLCFMVYAAAYEQITANDSFLALLRAYIARWPGDT